MRARIKSILKKGWERINIWVAFVAALATIAQLAYTWHAQQLAERDQIIARQNRELEESKAQTRKLEKILHEERVKHKHILDSVTRLLAHLVSIDKRLVKLFNEEENGGNDYLGVRVQLEKIAEMLETLREVPRSCPISSISSSPTDSLFAELRIHQGKEDDVIGRQVKALRDTTSYLQASLAEISKRHLKIAARLNPIQVSIDSCQILLSDIATTLHTYKTVQKERAPEKNFVPDRNLFLRTLPLAHHDYDAPHYSNGSTAGSMVRLDQSNRGGGTGDHENLPLHLNAEKPVSQTNVTNVLPVSQPPSLPRSNENHRQIYLEPLAVSPHTLAANGSSPKKQSEVLSKLVKTLSEIEKHKAVSLQNQKKKNLSPQKIERLLKSEEDEAVRQLAIQRLNRETENALSASP